MIYAGHRTTNEDKAAAYVDYIQRLISKGEMSGDFDTKRLPFGKKKHIRKLFGNLRFACGGVDTAYNYIDSEMERRGLV